MRDTLCSPDPNNSTEIVCCVFRLLAGTSSTIERYNIVLSTRKLGKFTRDAKWSNFDVSNLEPVH